MTLTYDHQTADGTTAQSLLHPIGHYIAGSWQPPVSSQWLDVVDPSTGAAVGRIAAGDADDIALAVKAARASFDSGIWSGLAPSDRATVLRSAARLVAEQTTLLATIESIDSGKPIKEAEGDIAGVVDVLDYFAGAATKVVGQTMSLPEAQLGIVLREPVGVVGAITPWNFPLYVAVWKAAAALSVGCTVVLKPSELASITCLHLGELMTKAGLPDGALNVVSGLGATAGAPLSLHGDIDMLTFTGSTATGSKIMEARARRVLPVQVELGGKSPLVVFADADIATAADAAAFGAFFAQGENCNAGSRILVERSIASEFVQRLVSVAEAIRIGAPLDQKTELGSLISPEHLAKVEGFVDRARATGVTVACGGSRVTIAGCEGGSFYRPTVLTDVGRDHEVFTEEIFGPVVTVTVFDSEIEAADLANATVYGLAAGVWTQDIDRAFRMTRTIRSGYVWINTYNTTPVEAPFGGVKRSGFGRDTAMQAIDNYLVWKTVAISTVPFAGWYRASARDLDTVGTEREVVSDE